ncbi:MAG: hypothetical protein Q9159_004099 [Coniocarpon cinnabarinum]
MQTREEKLATWADPSIDQKPSIRILNGSVSLDPNDSDKPIKLSEDRIRIQEVENCLLRPDGENPQNRHHFKAISFPRLEPGRLKLSFPKPLFQQIQKAWNLHPRTFEVFLSNNGVFTTFHSSSREQSHLLMKVPNSRSTGFDCVSISCDYSRHTTYALYHHLEDEAAVFATLLSTPERCVDPHFFVSALYREHHQHIERHRNAIDDTIQGIERKTGLGNPGRVVGKRRPSLDEYPSFADPKSVSQQLSYCQTDVAVIGHIVRCALDCGDWLVKAIDEAPLEQSADEKRLLREVRAAIRQETEYTRRRTAMIASQVQALRERIQSQTNYVSKRPNTSVSTRAERSKMLSAVAQSDAEYTAAIAVDGKRDSIAMKTISILGIVFLPGTFVATILSIDMFQWGGVDGAKSSLTVSRGIWVYFAITVPLTVLTIIVWLLWARRETIKSSKRFAVFRRSVTSGPGTGTPSNKTGVIAGEKMV